LAEGKRTLVDNAAEPVIRSRVAKQNRDVNSTGSDL
jgi:hypothetical protein